MKIEQQQWTPARGWTILRADPTMRAPQLVLVFGATECLEDPSLLGSLKARYPGASLVGCSTAGEISGTRVSDGSIVATALHFAHTRTHGHTITLGDNADSFSAGCALASSLTKEGLVHAFVLSDGQRVNGSLLTQGLLKNLPPGVTVTGGVAGDGARFAKTLVFLDSPPGEGKIALLGFYGERLRVGYGSLGGWDPFGPERLITRSRGNILYELDGQSALQLYKKYLGEHAAALPASALLFPLSLRSKEGRGLVRTILQISEEDQSMIFAGDVPEGSYARLMKANFERLIDGATGAAKTSYEALGGSPELAILISCVGRKMVLKQRVEEEVESVREILGTKVVLTGFYSYGEISPFGPVGACELHNQTMTITTLREL